VGYAAVGEAAVSGYYT